MAEQPTKAVQQTEGVTITPEGDAEKQSYRLTGERFFSVRSLTFEDGKPINAKVVT